MILKMLFVNFSNANIYFIKKNQFRDLISPKKLYLLAKN